MTTIEQLKQGKCLCLHCQQITNPAWDKVRQGYSKDWITVCGNECRYGMILNDNYVAAITWEGIQSGEGTPDGLSQKDWDWLKANHPDVIEEIERVLEAQEEAFKATQEKKTANLNVETNKLHAVVDTLNEQGALLKANLASFTATMAKEFPDIARAQGVRQ